MCLLFKVVNYQIGHGRSTYRFVYIVHSESATIIKGDYCDAYSISPIGTLRLISILFNIRNGDILNNVCKHHSYVEWHSPRY